MCVCVQAERACYAPTGAGSFFFGPVVAGYILAALSSIYDLVTNELKNELKEV